MIESILAELSRSDFDFRQFANPEDSLAELFPEWVGYYRLKFAIAKVLQPRSILEVGVRFGYSAVTFLKASPNASYLGIDLDSNTFGGDVGALGWARHITAGYSAEFIVADSQKMERFPGGVYDLIHVDGQQDGTGTFHDLRRAVAQARWILLDGYFWTQQNFFNANDFLLKHKDVIQYALTIPGYAGEFLLRVSDEYAGRFSVGPLTDGVAKSGELTQFYDSHYYLNDCGGYREFRQSGAQRLQDSRLLSLLILTRMSAGGEALDLGCGRGEISYQLALSGRNVTAVDYSAAAIELAKSCFDQAQENARGRVDFILGDVGALHLEKQFGVALAGDLIEHLSPAELERLFSWVAAHLGDDGVFVIHTAPNVWRYRAGYRRRKAAVERLGGYLPAEPRTRYELLMHINEQSPARLRRSLGKVFAHVAVWVARPDDLAGSLTKKLTRSELIDAPDIYALASANPIDVAKAATLLENVPLAEGEHARFSLQVHEWPGRVAARAPLTLLACLTNHSDRLISSLGSSPIHISYHWAKSATGEVIVFEGVRSSLPSGLGPGETRDVVVSIEAPGDAGVFLLTITMVEEGCCWFEQKPGFAPATAPIEITGA